MAAFYKKKENKNHLKSELYKVRFWNVVWFSKFGFRAPSVLYIFLLEAVYTEGWVHKRSIFIWNMDNAIVY